jgi:flavin-dependent dehydrogenase
MKSVDLKRKYDVAIVGAGPGGAAAAKVLVDAGLSVLVLEKKKVPRDKMCTGLIFGQAQELVKDYFGEIPKTAFAKSAIEGVRIHYPGDQEFFDVPGEAFGSGGKVLHVWRSGFDQWLIDQSNATLLDGCSFLDFKGKKDYVILQCKDDEGKEVNIQAGYLIGADGGASDVRDRIEPDLREALKWIFFYEAYHHKGSITLEQNLFHFFLDNRFSEVFYSWFNAKDDFLVFGTSVKVGSKVEPYFAQFLKFLKDKYELTLGEIERRRGCTMNNMASTANFCLGRDRVLLVGEAAGFVSLVGEGITGAIATGHLAGQAILECHRSGKDVLNLYTQLVEPQIERIKTAWSLGAGQKWFSFI